MQNAVDLPAIMRYEFIKQPKSPGKLTVQTLTVTALTRNISRVMDRMQHEFDEVVNIRNRHPVARLMPCAPAMMALEALGDLYRTSPDVEGARWLRDSRRGRGRRTYNLVSSVRVGRQAQ